MSAHYFDVGSGPHDPDSRENGRGERNCGCRHDGHSWLSMCQVAKTDWQTRHNAACAAKDWLDT